MTGNTSGSGEMELEAISGAATVALTSTIVFVIIAKTWNAVTRTVSSSPNFSDRIMHEAAQRFRDELDRLSCSQGTYLSGALAFILLFMAAYVLRAKDLFAGYPTWQLYLQLAFLLLATIYAAYRLVSTILARRQVKFLRDANIAIGHQLQQLSAGLSRVYHDVKTSAGIVDHVIVGQSGIYAVNVIARRAGKSGSAQLDGNDIEYSDHKDDVSIDDVSAKTHRLEKEFRKLVGHKIRVRSVIALPGWEIGAQHNEKHLLVNERNIAMIRGWKDSSDHLMDEDVDVLQKELTARCLRT